MKKIVSISAFGFADTVCIVEETMSVDTHLPAVVIEDHKNKLFIYGADEAIDERTGLGLDDGDISSYTKRIPVALLWQKLKWSQKLSDKQDAANLIAKYVIQLVCDKYQIYAKKQADADTSAPSITKSFIKANCQLVLCIPDNFDEDEQQCLLNAFNGFEISLLWRSIAALLGHFTEHIAFEGRDTNKPSLVELKQTPQGFMRARATVHVLYLGPDSIDLSTYELTAGKEDRSYTLPVRLEPVYEGCSTTLSFLHYALSYASSYIDTLSKPRGYESNVQLRQAFNQSLRSQVIYQFPEAWGRKLRATPRALRLPLNADNTDAQWCAVQGLLSTDSQLKVKLSISEVTHFYNDYEFDPTTTSDQKPNHPLFAPQLSNLLKQKIEQDRRRFNIQHGTHSTLLITGPMAVANNIVTTTIINQLRQFLPAQEVHVYPINWPKMAIGGYIYQDRANNKHETYLDRLRKLSMVSSNADHTEYLEKVLINDKEEVSPIQTHERQERLVINQGSNSIELYVSSDPKFNDETINEAITTSFKDQGISVQFAKLPYRSGLVAPADEPVLVTVQQKALSGYVRFIIKPLVTSKVLPPRGEVQVFDPAKKEDFLGTLPQPVLIYPPLPHPDKLSFSKIKVKSLAHKHTIYHSESANYTASLVYYNGRFSMPAVEENVALRLREDLDNSYETLKDYSDTFRQKQYRSYRYSSSSNNLVESFIEELDKCLPITLYQPFGHPEFNNISLLVAEVMRTCADAKFIESRSINKLQRRYFMFVPDHPETIRECCDLTLRILENTTPQYGSLKLLIENHPRCFSPKSKDFCMTQKFAERMYTGSMVMIDEVKDDATADAVFKGVTVKGSQKLSVALSGLLYSLLWRKKEPSFLSDPITVAKIEGKLNTVLRQYQKIDQMIVSGEYANYNHRLHQEFKDRVHNFVHSKLEKQIPEVINFLKKEGSNPNIMAAITELDEES